VGNGDRSGEDPKSHAKNLSSHPLLLGTVMAMGASLLGANPAGHTGFVVSIQPSLREELWTDELEGVQLVPTTPGHVHATPCCGVFPASKQVPLTHAVYPVARHSGDCGPSQVQETPDDGDELICDAVEEMMENDEEISEDDAFITLDAEEGSGHSSWSCS